MTIRGYQKRMIILKNVRSEIFEEAQFILRSEKVNYEPSDILNEAERIINESTFGKTENFCSRAVKIRLSALYFIGGALCGGFLFALIAVLFKFL
ncbi:MAG: hypothetical protein E7623_01160 [Ruminococcaceae bacterium]|nr:hypothetical protein [Oscillospiraceae bacterium]